MTAVKLRDLERFKKSLAGTIEFAALIEQATPKARARILKEVEAVDPAFLKQAMKRVVYFDELLYLDEGILAEILAKCTPKILAFALYGKPADFSKQILRYLAYPQMKETLDEQDKLQKKPSESIILGARCHVLKIARQLEAKNKFIFELGDCPRFHEKTTRHLKLVK